MLRPHLAWGEVSHLYSLIEFKRFNHVVISSLVPQSWMVKFDIHSFVDLS